MNFEDFGFSPFSQEVGAHLGVDASERRIKSKRLVRTYRARGWCAHTEQEVGAHLGVDASERRI